MKALFKRMLCDPPLSPGPSSGTAVHPVYPLQTMLASLSALTWQQWGLYAFRRDPLRSKIPMDRRIQLTDLAVRCGEMEAAEMASAFGPLSPEEYCEKMNLTVCSVPKANDGGYVLFAQYQPSGKITIFSHCLDRAAETLARHNCTPITDTLQIYNLLLAHELFHAVEEKKGDALAIRSHDAKVQTGALFPRFSQVRCISEIASMAFAAKLCAAPYSPYLLDVFLTYGYSPEAASHLYEGIMDAVSAVSTAKEGTLS